MNKEETTITGVDMFNPTQFEYMQRLVRMLIQSELVPEMYRAKGPKDDKAFANALIAVDVAKNMGMSPFMVMQNLDIISGKPSFSGKFLIARINTSSKFETLKFDFKTGNDLKGMTYTEYVWNPQAGRKAAVVKKLDKSIQNMSCYAYTTPKGKEEPILKGMEISIEMAIREGWYFRNNSKWQTMAQQMLTYRATSFWVNAYAPELSLGIRTIEENAEIIDAEIIDHETSPDEEMKPPTPPTPEQTEEDTPY